MVVIIICLVPKYRADKPRKYKKLTVNTNANPLASEAVDLSNSVAHEEAVLMTQGFRPDFANQAPEPDARFNQAPFRTMKTKKYSKKKKRKKGKRVLKRVYYEANSQQSSYSSLMSDYVDIENSGNGLELNSNVVEEEPDQREPEQIDPIQERSQEDSDEAENDSESDQGEENYQSSPQKASEVSIPAEEVAEDPAYRIPVHNSPRESFAVFNQ
jgi:hypothetical protein